ncbi:hypothetical protein OUO06_09430 [Photobacterium damselae]|uniref:hypothetical protein n=1 Tax=Photobacterium damselae TaxID=38293 RepID=UPI003C6E00DA
MSHLSLVNRIPFTEIIFCGSRVYETGKLIQSKGIEPLVISNGIKPRIWLTVFLENGDTFFLVEDSKPKHESVLVNISINSVSIKVDDHIILAGRKTSIDSFCIDHCDLRTLGFNVYGDNNALYVQGNEMTGMTARGCGCLIGLN